MCSWITLYSFPLPPLLANEHCSGEAEPETEPTPPPPPPPPVPHPRNIRREVEVDADTNPPPPPPPPRDAQREVEVDTKEDDPPPPPPPRDAPMEVEVDTKEGEMNPTGMSPTQRQKKQRNDGEQEDNMTLTQSQKKQRKDGERVPVVIRPRRILPKAMPLPVNPADRSHESHASSASSTYSIRNTSSWRSAPSSSTEWWNTAPGSERSSYEDKFDEGWDMVASISHRVFQHNSLCNLGQVKTVSSMAHLPKSSRGQRPTMRCSWAQCFGIGMDEIHLAMAKGQLHAM